MTACARCDAKLEPGTLEGLCPRCLLAQAMPQPTTPHGAFVPPTPAELAPLFPHLEIGELFGQGGMGAVYRARQVKLDRLVALKILPPAVAKESGFAERFGREARALAKLAHPHIVGVHDFGDVNGLYYLVMEFVEGVNLRQALAAGKLEPAQALALVGEVCSALQYAHERGVVHRDIKPENVLLDRQGRAKIADFGLAKLVGQTQPGRLTGTQQAMGTPHYMAPEQWERPLEVDHRADVYSLGVVFYELLTGELPLGKFAPPSAKAGGDVRLDKVFFRAIEREPEQRYQQMSDMKSDVEAVGKPAAGESVQITLPSMAKVLIVRPLPDLNQKNESLRRGLLKAVEQDLFNSQLSVMPDINGDLLAMFWETTFAPKDSLILALLDLSQGKGDAILVFSDYGLFWRNSENTKHPGERFFSYQKLVSGKVLNHGKVVYLGEDRYICPNEAETGISAETLRTFLFQLRGILDQDGRFRT